MTASPLARRLPLVIIAAAAGLAALVFSIPPDRDLGAVVRLLIFHGASTWVNLAAFVIAALTSVWFLVRGARAAFEWASSLRYVALGLWVVNTLLGVLSMDLVWGGVRWDEPRLRMTFFILLASMLAVGIDLLFSWDRVTALFDMGVVGLVAYLTLGAEQVFHPESPVFNSGTRIIATFLGQVALIAVVLAAVVWLVRGRMIAPSAEKDHAIES